LPESTERKLKLKWIDLLDKYQLSGEHLGWHDKARLRRNTFKPIGQIGVVPSINVAEHRFTELAYAYWSIWNLSSPHEVFVGWLDAIKVRTSNEIESVWVGKSDWTSGWYKKMCVPAVEKELDTRVRDWTKKARAAELAYLERYGKTPAIPNPAVKMGAPETMGTNVRAPVQPELSAPSKPKLNLELISKFIDEEGYKNDDLATQLNISPRAVSSLRNDGEYHGAEALTKLANLMKCEVDDLLLP
jgi:DNA-binding Xre family transcriptional regulator